MKGKDCVAIACDKRLGLQMQTVAVDFEKIFELAPTTFIGLAGLATDVQTVYVFFSLYQCFLPIILCIISLLPWTILVFPTWFQMINASSQYSSLKS